MKNSVFMKKIISISLFIFWTIFSVFIGGGLSSYVENQGQNGRLPASPGSGIDGEQIPSTGTVLNSAEISRHNSTSDCWMIINGKVYNFTSYINQHPGGPSEIIRYCGGDGTVGFDTKDKSNPKSHSAEADALLAGYYIGDLNQTISSPQNLQSNNNNTVNPATGGVRRETEYDDD